ncbi:MAG: acyltransferase family protein [Clostridium sp.]
MCKNFNALDLMKFILSLFIIAIHFPPLDSYSSLGSFLFTEGLSRIAVPLFFITSGFFFAYKDINNNKSIYIYIRNLIKLYIFWSIIYLPYSIYDWVINDKNLLLDILIYIKNFLFVGSFIQLWFFIALALGIILLIILLKKFSINKILFLSFILYLIGVFGDSYYGFLNHIPSIKRIYDTYLFIFETTKNGVFFGFFFVTLGYYINIKDIKSTKTIAITGSLLSLILILVEALFIKFLDYALDFNMYFSLIPASFFIFILIKEIKLPNNPIYPTLRKSSVLIFEIHPLISALIFVLAYILGSEMILNNSLLHYLSITILSIISSFTYLYLKKRSTTNST